MRMISIAAALALAATAAAPGAAAPKKGEPGYDSERQICKSVPVLGSRLKRIRQCATADQWEDMRAQERAGLQRKQYNGSPGCMGCDATKDSW